MTADIIRFIISIQSTIDHWPSNYSSITLPWFFPHIAVKDCHKLLLQSTPYAPWMVYLPTLITDILVGKYTLKFWGDPTSTTSLWVIFNHSLSHTWGRDMKSPRCYSLLLTNVTAVSLPLTECGLRLQVLKDSTLECQAGGSSSAPFIL